MNWYKLDGQYYRADYNLVILVKFYLLDDYNFRREFRENYASLVKRFYEELTLGCCAELDFDVFLTAESKPRLMRIFDLIIKHENLNAENIVNKALVSEVFWTFSPHVMKRIVSCASGQIVRDQFLFLWGSICNNSLYTVSNCTIEDLEGEWISIRETDQLRINYNMMDVCPVGNTIKLVIEKADERYYRFKCFATVKSYYSSGGSVLLEVYHTWVVLRDGYLYHFRCDDELLVYRKPVCDFDGSRFSTQIQKIDFTFSRKTDS